MRGPGCGSRGLSEWDLSCHTHEELEPPARKEALRVTYPENSCR